MKLLITGISGQVGKELCAAASRKGIDYAGFSSAELDITRVSKVARALRRVKPTLVINAAAYTAVDDAEDQLDQCMAVNRDGVANLAASCRRQRIPLIHLSTDYVFDGTKPKAYVETDETRPLNNYGLSKLAGEDVLVTTLEQHVILRLSWVFSPWRSNFVKTMIRLAQERSSMQIVDDQRGSPTSAEDIARVVISMAQQIDCGAQVWGTYHYASKDDTTWHGFAQEIVAEVAKYQSISLENIAPISTDDYPFKAGRPLNSLLNCNKIRDTFGIQRRSWRPYMRQIVHDLCCSKEHSPGVSDCLPN